MCSNCCEINLRLLYRTYHPFYPFDVSTRMKNTPILTRWHGMVWYITIYLFVSSTKNDLWNSRMIFFSYIFIFVPKEINTNENLLGKMMKTKTVIMAKRRKNLQINLNFFPFICLFMLENVKQKGHTMDKKKVFTR